MYLQKHLLLASQLGFQFLLLLPFLKAHYQWDLIQAFIDVSLEGSFFSFGKSFLPPPLLASQLGGIFFFFLWEGKEEGGGGRKEGGWGKWGWSGCPSTADSCMCRFPSSQDNSSLALPPFFQCLASCQKLPTATSRFVMLGGVVSCGIQLASSHHQPGVHQGISCFLSTFSWWPAPCFWTK